MTKEEAKRILESCKKITYDGGILGPKTRAKLKEALSVLFSKKK